MIGRICGRIGGSALVVFPYYGIQIFEQFYVNSTGFVLYLCSTPLLFTAIYAIVFTGNPLLILGLFIAVFLVLGIVQSRNYSHGNESNHGSLTTERMRQAQDRHIEEVLRKRCGKSD